MKRSVILACGGASLALAIAPAAALAGPKVSVRIEGATRTLQAAHTVKTPRGSITRFGAPAGICSASSAAGALDAATHHGWSGKYYSSFGDYLISSILGDTPNVKTGYWGIWVDNRYAITGACAITLHSGDHVLFAVDSVKHHEHPLGIVAAAQTAARKPFKLQVVAYSDSGKASPVSGARVRGSGLNAVTNRRGYVTATSAHAGTSTFTASDRGYIRAAATTVTITS